MVVINPKQQPGYASHPSQRLLSYDAGHPPRRTIPEEGKKSAD
jgi:hypothetical protein